MDQRNQSLPPPGSESESESDSGASNPLDLKRDEGWEDVEPDVEKLQFVSFFDAKTFDNLPEMLDYMREAWSFDLKQLRDDLRLDFMETMKFVNYVRSEVSNGNSKPDVGSKQMFADDKYLQPTMADDAVLFNIDDIETDVPETREGLNDADTRLTEAQERILELEQQLQEAKRVIDGIRLHSQRLLDAQYDDAGPSEVSRKEGHSDDYYFNSYAFRDIHETMLKDTARTDAYRDFIYNNKQHFKDKIVLDVGCGTAVLSMMCAKAGAKRVLAVDNSEIIHKAQTNVFLNGLQDTVTCIHGKVEEIELPVDKVDIIVSEWMGYALLYEAMLDSVIWARDRWLVPGGLIVPCDMYLCIAPLADPSLYMEKISFWNDVYGFDMTSMQEGIFDDVMLMDCQESTIASNTQGKGRHNFLHLDLYTTKLEDQQFVGLPFSLEMSRDIDSLDGFVVWFDSGFGRTDRSESVNELSTGPHAPYTHWMQTVTMINHLERKPLPLKKDQLLKGSIGYERPKQNQRQLKITIAWNAEPAGKTDDAQVEKGKQSWKLE